LLKGRKLFNNPYTEDGAWEEYDLIILSALAYYQNIVITRADFLHWLNAEGEPLPKDCLLCKWWENSEPQTKVVGDTGTAGNKKTKRLYG